MDEEEKNRYAECTNCEDCVSWHHHCNAECCKTVVINVDLKRLELPGKYLVILPSRKLEVGDILYYKYRNVEYVRGLLRFRKDRLSVIGGKVFYFYPCSKLKGNLCMEHGKNKPAICKSLTLETAKLPGQPFALTPNCLFKYKCKEVK